MERRRLGRTDIVASVLGFGGSEIGYERASVRTVERLLGGALDAGLNVVDTAECYEDSEALIGKAIGERRREVHLFTKCGHPGGWSRANWRPKSLLTSIERSLKRLRTDYLDLIQLHSCSLAELRKGDVIAALEQARERGWARYIGYSGDGEAARYAVECGRFDTLQTSVSVADQQVIDLTLPLARARNVGVIAKRPLANVAWRYARKPSEPYYQTYWSRLRRLDYAFLRDAPAQRGGDGPALHARACPVCTRPSSGPRQPERWQQNAALLAAGALPPKEFERIRSRWREVAGDTWEGQV